MNEHCRVNKKNIRIVSIVPSSRGSGIVVIESPPMFSLYRTVLPVRDDYDEQVEELDQVLTWYRPDVLILEETRSKRCRRGERYRKIVDDLDFRAAGYGIAVRPVARDEVVAHFELRANASKVAVARKVAELVPGLEALVPSERRLWNAEPHWQPMFDAMAHILTAFRAQE